MADNTTLYIIGNGFDIYHGLKSSWSDFKQYLCANKPEQRECVEKYLAIDEHWNEFEEALADIDVTFLFEDNEHFLQPYSAEDWSDSYHHDFQDEIHAVAQLLSSNLLDSLALWIRLIRAPALGLLADVLLPLKQEGLYLSFNYTPTLEHLYGISRTNILYIHGNSHDEVSLVVGHARKPEDLRLLTESESEELEKIDTRELQAIEIAEDYFEKTFKPTANIIETNKKFFRNLGNLREIFVFGHSLSRVDLAYFEEIIRNIDVRSVCWKVSYHSKEEYSRHRGTLLDLGVPASKLELKELSDFRK